MVALADRGPGHARQPRRAGSPCRGTAAGPARPAVRWTMRATGIRLGGIVARSRHSTGRWPGPRLAGREALRSRPQRRAVLDAQEFVAVERKQAVPRPVASAVRISAVVLRPW